VTGAAFVTPARIIFKPHPEWSVSLLPYLQNRTFGSSSTTVAPTNTTTTTKAASESNPDLRWHQARAVVVPTSTGATADARYESEMLLPSPFSGGFQSKRLPFLCSTVEAIGAGSMLRSRAWNLRRRRTAIGLPSPKSVNCFFFHLNLWIRSRP